MLLRVRPLYYTLVGIYTDLLTIQENFKVFYYQSAVKYLLPKLISATRSLEQRHHGHTQNPLIFAVQFKEDPDTPDDVKVKLLNTPSKAPTLHHWGLLYQS
jgi:hypothetical protein